ncbi:glycosyltransferase family protein, partial [Myxococcus sp. AB025B]
ALPDLLKAAGIPCRVYGLRRDLTEDLVDGNLTYRPFSEKGFIDDLRTSRGVVASGGFTLMSEAVYLRKPVLSIPLEGQFEQIINALYLEQLGYGMYVKTLTVDALKEFLSRVPRCQQALQGYEQEGNTKMLTALEEQLALAYEHRGHWAMEMAQD